MLFRARAGDLYHFGSARDFLARQLGELLGRDAHRLGALLEHAPAHLAVVRRTAINPASGGAVPLYGMCTKNVAVRSLNGSENRSGFAR